MLSNEYRLGKGSPKLGWFIASTAFSCGLVTVAHSVNCGELTVSEEIRVSREGDGVCVCVSYSLFYQGTPSFVSYLPPGMSRSSLTFGLFRERNGPPPPHNPKQSPPLLAII